MAVDGSSKEIATLLMAISFLEEKERGLAEELLSFLMTKYKERILILKMLQITIIAIGNR